MQTVFLFTFFAASNAQPLTGHVLPVRNVAHTMMLSQVYLNGQGPFRMLVDTGATSSALRPDIAARLGVRPLYRVEQMTLAGSVLANVGKVQVRVGGVLDEGVEMLFSFVAIPEADGVLGQSWLDSHAYLLDFAHRRIVLDGEAPVGGLRLALRESDGRPCLEALVDGQPQDLVLDSGTPVMVLSRPIRHAERVRLRTNTGPAEAGWGKATLRIAGFRRSLDAAEVPREGSPGLLPASIFRAVYVSKPRGLMVLLPR